MMDRIDQQHSGPVVCPLWPNLINVQHTLSNYPRAADHIWIGSYRLFFRGLFNYFLFCLEELAHL